MKVPAWHKQGRDATKQLIKDNPELAEEIEQKIKAKIAGKDFVPSVIEEEDEND